ncbi:MAG: DedA family protein [Myxococcales bacterium]|nr:DedA family protein [Myxococcales bacterium]
MIANILEQLAAWVQGVIVMLGYGGVLLLMAIESACIPLPSEIIMPFAGAVTVSAIANNYGHAPLNLWLVALAGAIGCNVGSVVAYFIGAWLGRPFLERTRWVRFFVTPHELERVDGWFARRGAGMVFVARLLPVVRTFIALPAGIARMNQVRFHVYTFLGSLPWCLGLAYLGARAGENWNYLRPWFHRFDAVIGVVIVVAAVWFIRSRLRALKAQPSS